MLYAVKRRIVLFVFLAYERIYGGKQVRISGDAGPVHSMNAKNGIRELLVHALLYRFVCLPSVDRDFCCLGIIASDWGGVHLLFGIWKFRKILVFGILGPELGIFRQRRVPHVERLLSELFSVHP